MRKLAFTLFLLLQTVRPALAGDAPHLYAVIFEATLGADDRIDDLKVSKVIDPSSGSTAPVDVAVPESFVAAAREQLRQRTYPRQGKPFFTYLFFDPRRPTVVNIDPAKGRQ